MSVIVEYFARLALFDVYSRRIHFITTQVHSLAMSNIVEDSIDIPDDSSDMTDSDSVQGKPVQNGQAVASVVEQQNAVLKFFGGVLTAAKERMLGDTWWIASDVTEIIEIPTKYLSANHTELERKDELILLKGSYTGNITTLYHVAIVWKKDGKTYSIWRSDLIASTKDIIRSVAPFAGLLKYIGKIYCFQNL